MDWTTAQVKVAPGDSVVARQGAAVVVAAPDGPAQDGFLDRLLALCATGAESVTPGMSLSLARDIGRLVLDSDPTDLPPFVLVTGSDDGLVCLLAGPMQVRVRRTGVPDEVLDGAASVTYLDRVVSGDVTSVLLGPSGGDVVADPRSSLTGGVVRGGGVVLEPAGGTLRDPVAHETLVDLHPASRALPAADEASPTPHPIPPPTPPPTPPLEPSFTPIALFGHAEPGMDGAAPASADVPELQRSEEPPDHSSLPDPQVQGIICSRGHFNAPNARFCARCGISMVHQTHNLVTGPRPPLGVLVLDDGSVHTLSTDYVLGRDPDSSDEVLRGTAAALAVDDPALAVSRVHARVLLDGWEVRLEDAGSANGTFVAPHVDGEWERLESQVPTTIVPGTRIRMGSRQLSFESHQHD